MRIFDSVGDDGVIRDDGVVARGDVAVVLLLGDKEAADSLLASTFKLNVALLLEILLSLLLLLSSKDSDSLLLLLLL